MKLAPLGLCAALLCLFFAGVAPAAPAADAPLLTAQQRQQIVNDVANAVIKKLGTKPTAAAQPPQSSMPGMGRNESLMRSGDLVTRRLLVIAGGFPDLVRQIASLHRALVVAGRGRPFASRPELLLLYALLLSLFAEKLTLLALGGIRRRIAAEPPALRHGARLAATDLAAFASFAVAAMVLSHLWFGGDSLVALTGVVLLDSALVWRGWMILIEILLRPNLPGARHVPIDNAAAHRLKFTLSVLLFATALALRTALYLWGGDAIACVTAATILIAVALLRLRRVVAALILGPSHSDPAAAGIIRVTAARHWHSAALGVLVVLYIAFLVAAFLGELTVLGALVRTLEILLALWGIEALCARGLRNVRRRGEETGEDLVGALIALRLLRASARTAAVTVLAYVWLVRTMLPISGLATRRLGGSIIVAGITLFLAYVLWEILRTVIERHLGAAGPRRPGEPIDPEAQARSRLVTLMPLLRIGLAASLFTVTGLVVLSQLGIDTAPLIAGASVLGLAISFGSQSLVRDIVSGIFFIADDAFRVGEYVDTGRLKGTVEGMTIRSLRLRHQNGQLHTIPFGQLGAVTNFSRDWATVKFNLRLARDTDIELLRRTVKKIGLDSMQNPQLAAQLIEPLKLQGIAEVADNALIVRLKFTSLPANSSWVQRSYLRLLYEKLPETGIQFANAVVAVQAIGGPSADPETAGAAALSLVVPPEAAAE